MSMLNSNNEDLVSYLPPRGKTYKHDDKANEEVGKFYSERDILHVSNSLKYQEKSFNLKQQTEDDDRENTPEKKYDKQADSLIAAKHELTNNSKQKHDSSIPHDTSMRPRKGDRTPNDDTLSQSSMMKMNLSSIIY